MPRPSAHKRTARGQPRMSRWFGLLLRVRRRQAPLSMSLPPPPLVPSATAVRSSGFASKAAESAEHAASIFHRSRRICAHFAEIYRPSSRASPPNVIAATPTALVKDRGHARLPQLRSCYLHGRRSLCVGRSSSAFAAAHFDRSIVKVQSTSCEFPTPIPAAGSTGR